LLIFLARAARLDQRIKTVVNIGVGGSDLGPVMLYRALWRYADGASRQ
jgi:glucose-6-phosphate isomerase